MMSAEPVTMVLSRTVHAAQKVAFETALADLSEVAEQAPGRISAEVLRGPVGGKTIDYHLVYRFDSTASLRTWEASPERALTVAAVESHCEDRGRRAVPGLEAWIDLAAATSAPTRSRLALLTWAAIWPLVSITLWLVTPLLALAPFVLRTACISAVLVLTMTYIVMPLLVRVSGPWLSSGSFFRRQPRSSSKLIFRKAP